MALILLVLSEFVVNSKSAVTMKNIKIKCLLLLSLIGLSPVILAEDLVSSMNNNSYLLVPEDVLDISVWKEEGLQSEVLVRPDGKLSFPLVGHIQAAGRTPEQVEQVIKGRLKAFIPDPVVTVLVRHVSGKKVYVIGKISKPGQYVVQNGTDVMQVLSLAGGLTPFANAKDLKVLRRTGANQTVFKFNYDEVSTGLKLEQNMLLDAGDVVVVR